MYKTVKVYTYIHIFIHLCMHTRTYGAPPNGLTLYIFNRLEVSNVSLYCGAKVREIMHHFFIVYDQVSN